MKALAVLALVVPLLTVTSVGVASGTSTKKSVTLHLVEKSVGFNFIDNPPRQGGNAPPPAPWRSGWNGAAAAWNA